MSEIIKLLSQSAGLRAYIIRVGILEQTKKYIADRYHISSQSIKQFEESPILKSQPIAEKLYKAFLDEGCEICYDWFFYGRGIAPLTQEICKKLLNNFDENEKKAYADILLFKSRFPNSNIHIVDDNSNEPFFKKGDYVGFIWREISKIDNLTKLACIIEIKSKLSIRICTKISDEKIRIECLRENKTLNIKRIAPIMFHRPKKDYRILK